MDYSKSDWKLFQKKVPDWQEAYIEKLLKEYINLLEEPKLPSIKFWELKKRISNDQKSPGVLIEMTKKEMFLNIVDLINIGAITIADLDGFSNELIDNVEMHLKRMSITQLKQRRD